MIRELTHGSPVIRAMKIADGPGEYNEATMELQEVGAELERTNMELGNGMRRDEWRRDELRKLVREVRLEDQSIQRRLDTTMRTMVSEPTNTDQEKDLTQDTGRCGSARERERGSEILERCVFA